MRPAIPAIAAIPRPYSSGREPALEPAAPVEEAEADEEALDPVAEALLPVAEAEEVLLPPVTASQIC